MSEKYISLDNLKEYNKQMKEAYIEPIQDEIQPLSDEEIADIWDTTPGVEEISKFTMTTGFVPMWNGTTFEDGATLDELKNKQDKLIAGSNISITNNTISASVPNLASNKITKMTGYTKASSAAEVKATDSLNVAIGKLERALEEKQMTFRYFSVPAGKFYPIKRNGSYMIYNGKDADGNEQKITMVRRSNEAWVEMFNNAKQITITAATVAVDGRYTYQLCGMYYTGENSLLGIPTTEGFRQATTNYAYITSPGTFYVCESVQGTPLSYKDTADECIGAKGEAYKE